MFLSYLFYLFRLGSWDSKTFAQLLQPPLTSFLLFKYTMPVHIFWSLLFPLPVTLPSHLHMPAASQLQLSIISSERPSITIFLTLHALALWPLLLGGHSPLALLKRNNRHQMESLVLRPTSTNQDLITNLIAVSTSCRAVTFNLSTWNDLVSTSEIICPIDPFGSF